MIATMCVTEAQLKRLKVGKSLTLDGATFDQKHALRRLAYRLAIKIAIRTTPDGTKLWRIK